MSRLTARLLTSMTLCLALLGLWSAESRAQLGGLGLPQVKGGTPLSPWARIEARATFQSLFHWRNDSDFDRTRPTYDENGQNVGALVSILTPGVTFHINDTLRIHYEADLGLAYWSNRVLDEQNPQAANVVTLIHRELYGAGEFLDGRLGFRVGFARFADPTRLFVDGWMGGGDLYYDISSELRLGVFFGQIPDQTYEGIRLDENNFRRDIWVFGSQLALRRARRLRLVAGVTALYDSHVVGQTRWLVSPALQLDWRQGALRGHLGAALQAGQLQGQALDGSAQTLVAWAAQGGIGWRRGRLRVSANAHALSPDDAYEANGRSHAFLSSGRSRSATLLLTEDEVRDWFDNVDERLSSFNGGFFENRAGLFVGDVSARVRLGRGFSLKAVLGVATVLKPKNALGQTFVGVESDLLLRWRLGRHLVAQAVVASLIPGRAGAALVNRIDRERTDPMLMSEVSLLLRY